METGEFCLSKTTARPSSFHILNLVASLPFLRSLVKTSISKIKTVHFFCGSITLNTMERRYTVLSPKSWMLRTSLLLWHKYPVCVSASVPCSQRHNDTFHAGWVLPLSPAPLHTHTLSAPEATIVLLLIKFRNRSLNHQFLLLEVARNRCYSEISFLVNSYNLSTMLDPIVASCF